MNVYLKRLDEIELIKESGDILTKTIKLVGENIKPGITLLELDKIAEDFIRQNGAEPSCKNYEGFPGTLCLSVNEVVVHGIPDDYILKEGDIVSVDTTVKYKGYCSDCAYTYPVGNISDEDKKLLEVTKQSLYKAIDAAKVGKRLGDIGYTINDYITSNGFCVIEDYAGHGIGKSIHEDPVVENISKKNTGYKITNGLVIAIEPIIAVSTGKTKVISNGWNVITKNKCHAAHYEATIGFYNNETIILADPKNCEI